MTKSGACPSETRQIPGRGFLFLALAALFCLTALPGCRLSGGGSSTSTLRSPEGPAMDLAMGLYQRGESLKTMAVRGGANYTTGQRRHYFKFEALVSKPGRLSFTAIDPAGRPAFKLTSDGARMTGILYGANQYVVGSATAENFGRFIPLGLSPDQMIALMSGSQVRPASAGAKTGSSGTELIVSPYGRLDDERQLWRIALAGDLNQSPATAVIKSANYGPARNPEIAITYPTVKDVPREDLGGAVEPFPHTVMVEWTASDNSRQSLRVNYDEVRLGLALGDNHFQLARPEGFELVQLP